MEYNKNYTQERITKLWNDKGAFFAFSQSQFDESKKEGVKYVSMDGGLICPKEHAKTIWKELDVICAEGVVYDKEHHTKERIILRELCNHECFTLEMQMIVLMPLPTMLLVISSMPL